MMDGRVLGTREIVLPIVVHGSNGGKLEIDALVDMGFTGLLALSTRAIEQLGPTFAGYAVGTLADGSRVVARRFAVVVKWHDAPREAFAIESGGGPMIWMALLFGSRVVFEAEDGDVLTVENRR